MDFATDSSPELRILFYVYSQGAASISFVSPGSLLVLVTEASAEKGILPPSTLGQSCSNSISNSRGNEAPVAICVIDQAA